MATSCPKPRKSMPQTQRMTSTASKDKLIAELQAQLQEVESAAAAAAAKAEAAKAAQQVLELRLKASSAASSNDGAPPDGSVTCPSPPCSLIQDMGLMDDCNQYKWILHLVRAFMNHVDLPRTAMFRNADPVKLAHIYTITQERIPFMCRFVADWATREIVKQALKNFCSYDVTVAGAELEDNEEQPAAEEEEQETSDSEGSNLGEGENINGESNNAKSGEESGGESDADS
ncbi:uncharacterized protein EI90DRAFT_3128794 [Cantharellus anzutake]|uniref:uncharacterized protein n=1 Tax=Cantharellus anzutake TaxID=1750568 RepID=UPI001906F012|nr:uncharacterized protein EI90DRAFT_3128794 [Cantharellus anzutake]KAF8325436.1 hypothetical protein EI90DRAFT_3128794 [Cantharellus anzutake]